MPATISRTGVQEYPGVGPGGATLREYRPDSEVFAAASLASLGSVPVTLGHPPVNVTPANVRDFQIGHVSDAAPEARVKVDGSDDEWVRAQLVVADGGALGKIDAQEALEVSCGYSCWLDMTPGVTPGGVPYDAVQRDIIFNHVAILTTDQRARAGAEAKLRLDNKENPMKIVVIDGVEYELGSDKHLAKLTADHQKALAAVAARADALQAQLDALQAKHDAEKTRADAATAAVSAERIDAAVEARLALFARASRLLPSEYDTKGKSDAQVRADAVTHKLSAEKVAGKSAAYLDAMFDILVDSEAPAAPAVYHKPAPGVRADATANINDNDDAFRASLKASK